MSYRMKLQVIEDWPEKDEFALDKAFEVVWDFELEHSSYFHWFMWFANDPPVVIRISCESAELLEALMTGYDQEDSGWERFDPESEIPFYQEGDHTWMLDAGSFRLYLMICPELVLIGEDE